MGEGLDHSHHGHHVSESARNSEPDSVVCLAVSATTHCLIGCGIGEVLGMTVGMALHMSNVGTIILAVIAGLVLGFAFGMWPLLRAGFGWRRAARQVLIAEGLSIAVMEIAEVLVQVYTPGVMEAGLHDPMYWIGMAIALVAGFAAAYPVNFILIKRGVRHQH